MARPEDAPDEPQTVTVAFEGGCPVALDGERLGLVELLERAAELGRRHGVGIVDHVEDRIVGLKVRDLYEVPAAAIVLTAHRELEKLVCTIHQNKFKPALERQWAYLCYAGLWHEPLRSDLDAYMDAVNGYVTGEVAVKLYKGSAYPRRALVALRAVRSRRSPAFGESGGEFSQDGEPRLHRAVLAQSRMAHRIRSRAQREGERRDEQRSTRRSVAWSCGSCASATGARSGSPSASESRWRCSAASWPRTATSRKEGVIGAGCKFACSSCNVATLSVTFVSIRGFA